MNYVEIALDVCSRYLLTALIMQEVLSTAWMMAVHSPPQSPEKWQTMPNFFTW